MTPPIQLDALMAIIRQPVDGYFFWVMTAVFLAPVAVVAALAVVCWAVKVPGTGR